MATSTPTADIRRVTLSVAGHVYTAEICWMSPKRWSLLAVEVQAVGGRSGLAIETSSCLSVLEEGERVAQEIIAQQRTRSDAGG